MVTKRVHARPYAYNIKEKLNAFNILRAYSLYVPLWGIVS